MGITVSRLLRWSAIVLACVLLSAPASAQEEEEEEEDKLVTVTFRLILYGEAVEGQTFAATLDYIPSSPGSGPHPSFLCGRFTPTIGGPEVHKPCKGGGTVFTATRQAQVGRPFEYGFFYEPRGAPGAFAIGTATVYKDTTFEASYTFPRAAGESPQAMPDTGAGGMAGGALPTASVAATLSMLIAGAYTAVRYRW